MSKGQIYVKKWISIRCDYVGKSQKVHRFDKYNTDHNSIIRAIFLHNE